MFSVQQSVDKHQVSSIKALILKLGLKSWDFTNANQSLFWCLDYKTMILSMHFYSFQVLWIMWTTSQVLIVIFFMNFFCVLCDW